MSLNEMLQNVELALVKAMPSEKSYLEAQETRKTTSNVCEDCGKQVK